jgi:hypothetical protein
LDTDNTIFLNDSDWLESPCSTCGGAFCCSNLPLCDLSVETRSEMLLMADLCWFEGLVPVLKDDGQWRLFYHAECGFFHKITGKCSIHDTPLQTDICRKYSPYSCWYKKAFTTAETDTLIRFNGERVEKLISMMLFDDTGVIQKAPPWIDIQRAFSDIPYIKATVSAPKVLMEKAVDSEHLFLLPPGKPRKPGHLDLIKFRLGFPGVMVMISPTLWCFAIPALVKLMVPENFKELLLQRLADGVYDAIIMGISDGERDILHAGGYQKVTNFGAISQQSGINPVKGDPEKPEIVIS